ncbi:glycoside hydrolase family 2 protein [Flagellimonas sp. HMM57]|uniref:beta-mannosidase n=1 Tax=unclassified Flagellimonas TaxID=2644544 RepID=UPI0013D0AAB1|nr:MULTISPECIES: glycoside hydrolase family 2 protein [unclassified Flagellimonas]UII75463.1 glycoside hydrolase family 2 protein [Flagellimonas sp. HMM57]
MKKLNFIQKPLYLLVLILVGCAKKTPSEMVLKDNWEFRNTADTSWLKAQVPGTVHTDLLDNNKIKDPFFRLNERELQWVDKADWEYQTTFDLTEEETERDYMALTFRGLDTYADVYLNGTLLLQTDNMFRTYEVSVKQKIKVGQNRLRVVLASPIKKGIEKYDKVPYVIPVSDNDLAALGQVPENKKVSVYTRKAGYHFGWDWGPRLVTSGIWRPVTLKSWDDFVIKDLFVQQEVLDTVAKLKAHLELTALVAEEKADVEVTIDDITVLEEEFLMRKGTHQYDFSFKIADPELWWPNGLGNQKLYTIGVKIKGRKSQDTISKKVGLRTIELVTEKDSIGSSFFFKVNGHPIFMKGANYIPNDVFLPRVDKKDYENVINAAVETNMNMLRVWGGGIYEDDYFYELCDEKGILVWQDFMFACAMFPGDTDFLNNIREEAIDNVKRLRNHPSIALWCGNNEILSAWKNWGWEDEMKKTYGEAPAQEVYQAYQNIFHKILPEVVNAYDADRRYWASSPSTALGEPESLTDGDRHYWGVWWGKEPFSNFEKEMPRFMSEFGFQSFPELSTVEKYAIPEDYDIYSEVMKSHQRSSIGNETIEEYMLRHYKKPKNFESYLYLSHLLQAYGIGEGIAAHRRNRERCMGSLYWQINDCWPVASWSSIDYYGKWKALHYTIKRAFEPLALSITKNTDAINVVVLNDHLEAVSGKMTLQLLDFSGTVLESWEETITVDGNSTKDALAIDKVQLNSHDEKATLLHASFSNGTTTVENISYRVPFKELVLPSSGLTHSITEKEGRYEVHLKTEKLAKDVYLASRSTNNFSDNYFDLLPGQKKTVFILKDGSDLNFAEDLKVLTLDTTY